MNELAGQSLGGYQLVEEIGHGSMGVVYRGKQIALDREVAVKVLPQALARDVSYVARFIREAQIIAGLNHPNIVQIYDAGQQHRLLYFVMEFVQGPTLASLLHLDGKLPLHLAAEYAAQIAEALDAAYNERHVIHRDIKPENLMLNRWGKVKVMDFGLARAPGHQQITMARTLVGSIYYASPEQVWGQELDNRSDIYALGVVLYEMVCGKRPFTGRSMPELTQAIIRGNPQPPRELNPEISSDLEQIMLTALALDRNQRYEEAILLAHDLRSLQLQPAPPPPSSRPLQNSATPAGSEAGPPTARNRVVIQPPKRPRQQNPHYLDAFPAGQAGSESAGKKEPKEQREQREQQTSDNGKAERAQGISEEVTGPLYSEFNQPIWRNVHVDVEKEKTQPLLDDRANRLPHMRHTPNTSHIAQVPHVPQASQGPQAPRTPLIPPSPSPKGTASSENVAPLLEPTAMSSRPPASAEHKNKNKLPTSSLPSIPSSSKQLGRAFWKQLQRFFWSSARKRSD